MTLIWEEVEIFRGNNPYADRRAESELIREERLRRERQEEERRQLPLRVDLGSSSRACGGEAGRGTIETSRGPSDEP
jgi:hypothetical protein